MQTAQLTLQFEPERRLNGHMAAGRYTVVTEDGHRTYKIDDVTEGSFRGKTIVSVLIGPDNTRNYLGIGFLNRQTAELYVWSRHRGTKHGVRSRYDLGVIMRTEEESRLNYALKSGRCARCGRELTVPASIHRGLGPECAKRI
jgi:hypothetical protein